MNEFNIELLLGVDDLIDEHRMNKHRASMDKQALAFAHRSKFHREEITPYIVWIRKPGDAEAKRMPETAETRRYKVFRRYYI